MNTPPVPKTILALGSQPGDGAAASAAFVLPVIRTMADDLAAKEKGGFPEDVVAPPTDATAVPALPLPPRRGGGAGKNIALPTSIRSTSAVWYPIVLGVVVALVIAGGGWAAWTFLPRPAGGILDEIPADALAFVTIKRGTPVLEEKLLPKLTQVLGMTPEELGGAWEEVAYVLIPGGSPSEPVPFLLVHAPDAQALPRAAENMTVKKLPSGSVAIIETSSAGRLAAVSSSAIGGDGEFRQLSSLLPLSPVRYYLREGQSGALLTPFSFPNISQKVSDTVVLALLPRDNDGKVVAVAGARSEKQPGISPFSNWDGLLRALPVTAIGSVGRANFGTDFDLWRAASSGNPSLQDFFRLLSQQGPTLDGLRAHLAGPYLVGTLVTGEPGVRDGFVVLTLNEDAQPQTRQSLGILEDAFRQLSSFIAGSTFPGAVFEESVYRDVTIRFVNFGGPERTLDYAVVDNSLVVTTSRDSMRLVIDVLRKANDKTSVADDRKFQSLSGVISAGSWSYLRPDATVRAELPKGFQALLAGFQDLYIQFVSEQTFTGAATLNE